MNQETENIIQKIVFCKPKKKEPVFLNKIIIEEQKYFKLKKKNNNKNTEDIFEIHKSILESFEKDYENLSDMKDQCNKLQWIVDNTDNDYDKQQAKETLGKLNTEIKLIESGFKEAKYLFSTEKLLQEYTQLLSEPIRIDFMGNKIDDKADKKTCIITEFLNIAKNYINIKPIEGQKRSMLCDKCKLELQREDDFLFVCPNCGYAIKHFASVSSYGENNRINVAQRYVYDKRAHFGDSIKKFQAKQNTTILDQVYKDLWNKIHSHDISIDKITEDHIYEFLKLTGHSDHYEDIKLIYCEMTGKSAPDISHLEQKLFELFDEVDPVYERVKSPGRVNFLNGQFVLFKLLQKLKYPCKESDFYILRTREKMLEHDQIWKKICAELSWTYIPTA
jgi:predicted RNA-binding Zn-ribbon protein involved in translation (DUF1610 family)